MNTLATHFALQLNVDDKIKMTMRVGFSSQKPVDDIFSLTCEILIFAGQIVLILTIYRKLEN